MSFRDIMVRPNTSKQQRDWSEIHVLWMDQQISSHGKHLTQKHRLISKFWVPLLHSPQICSLQTYRSLFPLFYAKVKSKAQANLSCIGSPAKVLSEVWEVSWQELPREVSFCSWGLLARIFLESYQTPRPASHPDLGNKKLILQELTGWISTHMYRKRNPELS